MTTLEHVEPKLAEVFDRIERAAPSRDFDGAGLDQEMQWLHEAGALDQALPETLTGLATWSDDPVATTNVLRALGRASLPAGRLFEGHVNAGQLIALYGQPKLKAQCRDVVKSGGLLGVWGADGSAPVHAEATGEGFTLHGAKVFCSGLGVVQMALVSASLEGQTSLFAVDVRDKERADHDQWRVSGMRATQSGGFDFEGMAPPPEALVGGPGDYFVEPYFLGGMYRICAVQIGGLDALLDGAVDAFRRRGKAKDRLAQHRVGTIASLLAMAVAVTERLARIVAAAEDAKATAREAVLAREAVERCAVMMLEIVERSIGTEAHREAATISRVRRDLSFYLRQAAVDERLAGVGSALLEGVIKPSEY